MGSWICEHCGNDDTFTGTETYSVTGNRTHYVTFDGEGTSVDFHHVTDEEINDDDWQDSEVEECAECGSSSIVFLDDSEYDEWKEKYFDSQGTFHKEGVPLRVDSKGNLVH